MNEPTSVFIGVPCLDGRAFTPHVQSVVREVGSLAAVGIPATYVPLTGCSLIGEARNILTRAFHASPYSHLLFWDSDVEASPGSVLRLLTHNKPIVGAVGVKKSDTARGIEKFNCMAKDTSVVGSLMKMTYLATMFLLIHRNVFSVISAKNDDSIGNWFDMSSAKDGKLGWTEDYGFCKKANDAGFEVYADLETSLTHYGVKGYSADFRSYWIAEKNQGRLGGFMGLT